MVFPPQKNSNFSQQQAMSTVKGLRNDAHLLNNPKVLEAKRVANVLMQETGLSPQELKELGNAAELAIYDKSLYPMFLAKIRELGQEDEQVFGSRMNYGILAVLATAAKLV